MCLDGRRWKRRLLLLRRVLRLVLRLQRRRLACRCRRGAVVKYAPEIHLETKRMIPPLVQLFWSPSDSVPPGLARDRAQTKPVLSSARRPPLCTIESRAADPATMYRGSAVGRGIAGCRGARLSVVVSGWVFGVCDKRRYMVGSSWVGRREERRGTMRSNGSNRRSLLPYQTRDKMKERKRGELQS